MNETNDTGTEWWRYEQLPSGEPYDWADKRGDRPDDQHDFHLDIGCGRLKKARLGIDRFPDPGVDLVMDLSRLSLIPEAMDPAKLRDLYLPFVEERMEFDEKGDFPTIPRLPFPDNSIKSIVTHHALEHIGDGFIRLMDECFRILEHGGVMRIIVPLFPSHTAVSDPDHKRFFCESSFYAFLGTGTPGEDTHWMESFATPYTKARFTMPDKVGEYLNPDLSPPPVDARQIGGKDDHREMRVSLFKP